MDSSQELTAQASNTIRKDHKNKIDTIRARAVVEEGMGKKTLGTQVGSHTTIDEKEKANAPWRQSDSNPKLLSTRIGVLVLQQENKANC